MAWSNGLMLGTPTHRIASTTNTRIRVVAGPGTGKSFAMKRRVARLLESGVAPGLILPVTFTRVAAQATPAERFRNRSNGLRPHGRSRRQKGRERLETSL